MEEVRRGPADGILDRPPHDPSHGRGPPLDEALCRRLHDEVGCVLRQQAEPRLGLLERRLEPHLLGDVVAGALEDDRSVRPFYEDPVVLPPHDVAVPVPPRQVGSEVVTRLGLRDLGQLVGVLRIQGAGEEERVLPELLDGVADMLVDGVAQEQDGDVGVHPDPVEGVSGPLRDRAEPAVVRLNRKGGALGHLSSFPLREQACHRVPLCTRSTRPIMPQSCVASLVAADHPEGGRARWRRVRRRRSERCASRSDSASWSPQHSRWAGAPPALRGASRTPLAPRSPRRRRPPPPPQRRHRRHQQSRSSGSRRSNWRRGT